MKNLLTSLALSGAEVLTKDQQKRITGVQVVAVRELVANHVVTAVEKRAVVAERAVRLVNIKNFI